MCHLCRKVEALEAIDSKAIKPISELLSQLHKKIEPRIGDCWLQRHEQAVRIRGLLAMLHNTVPIKPLRDILESVDRELYHVRKNMPDHAPQLSIGSLDALNESIAPSSSASCQIAKHRLGMVEEESRKKVVIPKDCTDALRVF